MHCDVVSCAGTCDDGDGDGDDDDDDDVVRGGGLDEGRKVDRMMSRLRVAEPQRWKRK
jgi:hypothetical protein